MHVTNRVHRLFLALAVGVFALALVGCGPNNGDPVCGNGLTEAPEQCDDGNTMDGDGCSATCTIEMQMPVCGDMVIEGAEECDDGNTMDGDGCSATCTIEMGAVCGNGVVEIGETCEPPNTATCDALCQVIGPPPPPPIECIGDTPPGVVDLTTTDPMVVPTFTPTTHTGTISCNGPGPGCQKMGPETVIEIVIPAGQTDLVMIFDHAGGDLLYAVYSEATGMCVESECYDPYPAATGVYTFAGVSDGSADTTVYLVADACLDGSMVSADLILSTAAPMCGDGLVTGASGEQCDDSNTTAGDGCDGGCLIEATYGCLGQPSVCSTPSFLETGTSAPGLAIPDADPAGVADTLTIANPCTVSDLTVDVDITHTFSGDLGMTLMAPDMTAVPLKIPSMDATPNLMGTYPTTLTPTGDLFDFNDLDGMGTWTLGVGDFAMDDTGTLNSWGININCL